MTTGAPESGKLQVFKGNRISLVRPLFLYEFLSISIFTLAGGCGLGLPRFHDCVTGSNTWWPRSGVATENYLIVLFQKEASNKYFM